jgi:hypothetical protein
MRNRERHIDLASTMVMNVGVWQGLCAQFVQVEGDVDPD